MDSVGTPEEHESRQAVIEDEDLEALLDDEQLPVPSDWGWNHLLDGRPMPDVVAIIRRQRRSH